MALLVHVLCSLCLVYLAESGVVVNQVYLKNPPIFELSDSIIDGDEIDYDLETLYTIHFLTKEGEQPEVKGVTNFPRLLEAYIDNYTLTEIPLLANLPKLWKLSLARNELREVKNGSLSTSVVEIINLAANTIDTIYNNAFGSNVKEVLLTCNQLSSIAPNWFTNPEGLEVLHLGGNKIGSIPSGTFERFGNLRRLELYGNELTRIENLSLFGLHRLNVLDLSSNLLTSIPSKAFGDADNKTVIRMFNIENNLLNYLEAALWTKIDVEDLTLGGNPWVCACRRKILELWKSQGKNDENIRRASCVSPRIKDCDEQINYEAIAEYYKLFPARDYKKVCK